jgi:phage baseplate assembly protein W
MDKTGVAFPFRIDERGRVASVSGEGNLRSRIVQLLLTSPGERVHLPEYGCGLQNLLFDPANDILAATIEFTISAALQRWLGEEIAVENVNVSTEDTTVRIEVTYIRKDRLQRDRVVITV